MPNIKVLSEVNLLSNAKDISGPPLKYVEVLLPPCDNALANAYRRALLLECSGYAFEMTHFVSDDPYVFIEMIHDRVQMIPLDYSTAEMNRDKKYTLDFINDSDSPMTVLTENLHGPNSKELFNQSIPLLILQPHYHIEFTAKIIMMPEICQNSRFSLAYSVTSIPLDQRPNNGFRTHGTVPSTIKPTVLNSVSISNPKIWRLSFDTTFRDIPKLFKIISDHLIQRLKKCKQNMVQQDSEVFLPGENNTIAGLIVRLIDGPATYSNNMDDTGIIIRSSYRKKEIEEIINERIQEILTWS